MIADADTPEILFSSQLAGTVRTWVCGKGFDFWQDTANDRRIEDLKFVSSGTSEGDGLSLHARFLFSPRGGLVDPRMRASNEHIPIVRVPRAGG
jgi:hypothetical protein